MADGSFALFCWTDGDDNSPNGADGDRSGTGSATRRRRANSGGRTSTDSTRSPTRSLGGSSESCSLGSMTTSRGLQRIRTSPGSSCRCSVRRTTVLRRREHSSATTRPGSPMRPEKRGRALSRRRSARGHSTITARRWGKLGTSTSLDLVRMSAAIAEFTAARILTEAGYEVTPEIEVTTGHSLDFRATDPNTRTASLVEVTRPQPVSGRSASDPVAAVRDTAETKTSGQLEAHGGGVTLFVDCTSFPADDWAAGARSATGGPSVRRLSCARARTDTSKDIGRDRCRSICRPRSTGFESPTRT